MYHIKINDEEYWLIIKALNSLKIIENDDITTNSVEVESLIMKFLSKSFKLFLKKY